MPYVLRDEHGREFFVGAGTRIGSDRTNHVVVTGSGVSPVHAIVWEQNGALYVRDERSKHGTFVNGTRVQTESLFPGDQLRVGGTTLTVGDAPAGQPTQVAFATPHAPVPVQTQTRSRAGCCSCQTVLLGCFVIFLLIAALGVGGFLAIRNGAITPETVLNVMASFAASVEFDNFRDDTIHVSIEQMDSGPESTPYSTSFEIGSFDVHTFRIQQPARYRVDFGHATGSADLGSCVLTLSFGSQFQFVALPDNILIHNVTQPPSTGPDLIVRTSKLCR